ncbi:MAG TPA: ROK family protein [Mycobacteriales bacterium]|nr:ROK family protein [Mycobacteriales bacterium]
MPEKSILGFDIGGTKLAAGIVTAQGEVLASRSSPTRREEGPAAVLDRLFRLGRSALKTAGVAAPEAIGIGCGGPLDRIAGVVQDPPHLPGWHDVAVVDRARESFGVPAFLENDGTAAALGEFRYGAGRGSSTMLYLTISTGVGGGAVIDGRLHLGASGNGGEFGHITAVRDGRPCSCGRRGCLEAYVSGTSIADRARAVLATGAESTLSADLTAADVSAAAAARDPLAQRIWTETTALLGSALADLVNAFEPDLVVLGGGVTRAGAALLEPCARLVAQEAMPPAAAAARVVLSELGDLVGIVGAAQVALDRLINTTPRETQHV